MDRRLLIIFAIAGLGAAILFFPSGDVNSSHEQLGEDRSQANIARITTPIRAASPGTPQPAGTPRYSAPESTVGKSPSRASSSISKEDLAERLAKRKQTPFYEHSQDVAKRWLHLGNLLASAGDTESAQRARAVSRDLRYGIRPDGTIEKQSAALDNELNTLESLRLRYSENSEITEILNYIQKASQQFSASGGWYAEPEETPREGPTR